MLERLKNLFKRKEKQLKEEEEQKLDEEQKLINEMYELDGLTDEVLERQVALNELRNKLDISDSSKRIYKNFVQ